MSENIDRPFQEPTPFQKLRAETSDLRVRYALSTISIDSTRIMQRVAIRKILILRINVLHHVNLDLGLGLKVTLRGSFTKRPSPPPTTIHRSTTAFKKDRLQIISSSRGISDSRY